MEQAPAPLITLEEGGVVDLVVSLGVEMALVPDVVGTSRQEAVAQLEQAGLEVGRVVERDGDDPAGQVLEVLPGPGSQVRADSEVSLVVASGEVDVPLVQGETVDQATERLRAAGFSVAVRPQADEGRPGLVLDQSPAGGTAELGSVVTLVVSEEPPEPTPAPTTAPPSPTPSGTPSPSASPTPSGTPSATPGG